ncbi:GlsB/YeaQ/YmgE family stress response membrane protein [Streptomyces sp. UH6]|uniref:GlsB/YeaQ/YmgE family stress response membrane protein n=1 Tax=Streptomyces sp. UH6 TaxID=2748379 RepID=UPI0015D49FF1|nr:GlsB/YeaQ/YmgE family stress response membrane protein [Streptomyces sp. UH6]NYV77578.1 GlsB/YeaQ/YmgE family stress response membrane protein [Streptomyces sp. UH6]
MGVVAWVVLGLVAGAIAKVLMPGRDPGGLIGTTLIGVVGAFLGGWLSARFFDRPVDRDFYDPATWVSAVGGALVLLVAYRVLFGHSRERG